jgi:SAM-dependent methyltransferase
MLPALEGCRKIDYQAFGFMENLSSALYSVFDHDPKPIKAFVRWLAQTEGLGDSLTVLDVGCGPGRMLAEYAALGWKVVGMEPDSDFYEEARENFKGIENVEIRPGGLNDNEAVAEFHLITAINGPFAYLLEREAQADALRRTFRALKSGGLLFVDIPNLLWFLKNKAEPPPQTKRLAGGVVQLIEHYDYDLHNAIFIQTNEYHLEDAQGNRSQFCKEHKHAIISYPEWAYMAQKSGFSQIRTYPSYEACHTGPLGERIMISAHKG